MQSCRIVVVWQSLHACVDVRRRAYGHNMIHCIHLKYNEKLLVDGVVPSSHSAMDEWNSTQSAVLYAVLSIAKYKIIGDS